MFLVGRVEAHLLGEGEETEHTAAPFWASGGCCPCCPLEPVPGSGAEGRHTCRPAPAPAAGGAWALAWWVPGREAGPDSGVWEELLWVSLQADLGLLPGVLPWAQAGSFPSTFWGRQGGVPGTSALCRGP